MVRQVRLVGYVVATVLLPLVALAVGLVTVFDVEDRDPVLRTALAGAVVATVVAYAALRVAHRSVAEVTDALTERASALAAGHLRGDPLPVSGPPEVARLAETFNDLVETVRRTVEEAERREEKLRQSVHNLGLALSGAHDVDALTEVIAEAALLASGCRTAVLWRLEEGALVPHRTHGEARVRSPIEVGEGLAGRVAESGQAAMGDERALGEPHHEHAMAVPLTVGGSRWGVLATYGRASGAGQHHLTDDLARHGLDAPAESHPYTEADLEPIRTLARQAELALENARQHAEAEHLSVTDPLTGLANRRELDRRLATELERATRYGAPFSVAVLDLDHFKAVNDTHGHPAGDAVLVEVAARLQRASREVDLVARSGGEELTIVLPHADRATAGKAAARFRQLIAARPVEAGDRSIPITVSIGVATYPEHGGTADELVDAADEALYRAKAAGRNRVEQAVERADDG